MRILILLAFFISSAHAGAIFEIHAMAEEAIDEEWESWKLAHAKEYDSKPEEIKRFAIFLQNKKTIETHNLQGQEEFQMGLNRFSDMTPDEFKQRVLMSSIPNVTIQGDTFIPPPAQVEIPNSFSWRSQGAVTPVKDQGQCGSCWSFSTTGTLEGFHFRKTGKLVSLSEQNLLDCDVVEHGCHGGWPAAALEYVHRNHGIDTEQSYPYEARDHRRCR